MQKPIHKRIHTTGHKSWQTLGLALMIFAATAAPTFAQTNVSEPPIDISSSAFSFSVCDGPHNPASAVDPAVDVYDAHGNKTTRPYVVCNFNTLMLQVQHLINIAIVLGVLAAIIMFSYAGYLYVVGGSEPGKRSEASGIFKKVFIGFIIMLSAWFIVYQLLSWLAKPAATALLGAPH